MNYYTLPKNNAQLNIHPKFIEPSLLEPYLSRSLIYFFNSMQEQLTKYDKVSLNEMKCSINTYQYIYTTVPDTNISVSKVKPGSNVFYELMEIFHVCNLNETLNNKHSIVTMHFTPNHHASCYFLNIMREEYANDVYIQADFDIEQIKTSISNFVFSSSFSSSFYTCHPYASASYPVSIYPFSNERMIGLLKCDFLFFEFKKQHYKSMVDYFTNMIYTLDIIMNHQNVGGISIIKVDHLYYKVIVDVLYILSGFFEKIHIIKPTVSNVVSNKRYIVCKSFVNINADYHKYVKTELSKLISKIQETNSAMANKNNTYKIVGCLLPNNIPYYFTNKIEESNVVIGQHQLENIILMINTMKNKNKEDKIEIMNRNNIQKCILWCEKYKIPHNKFIDKTNIFLNIKTPNETTEKQPFLSQEEDLYENTDGGEDPNLNLDMNLEITDADTIFGTDPEVFLETELEEQIEIYEEIIHNEEMDMYMDMGMDTDMDMDSALDKIHCI